MYNEYIHHFKNRKEAGEKLTSMLADYKDKNAIVLGIPRGGVEIAYEVASALNLDWSVVVSKKLPYPGNEEYGFGAVTEEGICFVNEERIRLDKDSINAIVKDREAEVRRRVAVYRGEEPLPDMRGKDIIIVDDGIATGATLVPVIRLCRKKEAAKVIIAAPVSGKDFDKELNEADEIRILFQPDIYSGVGQAYRDFTQLTDEDVLSFLKRHRKHINH